MNPNFPVFFEHQLLSSPLAVSEALMQYGIVYIDFKNIDIGSIQDEALCINYKTENRVIRADCGQVKGMLPIASKYLFNRGFLPVFGKCLGPFTRVFEESFIQRSSGEFSAPSSRLHFDRRRTLKVWFYPFDVHEIGGGGMRVVAGSGAENGKIRRRDVNFLNMNDLSNSINFPQAGIVEELEAKSQIVYGEAGTVFLHDTDVWHGATELGKNQVRYIYRSHTRANKLLYSFI